MAQPRPAVGASLVNKRWAFLVLFLLVVSSVNLSARRRANPLTCEEGDVQTSVDDSFDGDTITIPTGSCTWTTTVRVGTSLSDLRNVTIQGSGSQETILTYNVPESQPTNQRSLFVVWGSGTELNRITNLRITQHVDNENNSQGIISWRGGDGDSADPQCLFRVDNVYFDYFLNWPVFINNKVCGVIDHNTVRNGTLSFVHGANDTWDSGTQGLGSFAAAPAFGGIAATYIETNDIEFASNQSASVFDSEVGARVVARFNRMMNSRCEVHGMEGGLQAGTAKWECYANDMSETTTSNSRAFHYRSGSGFSFANVMSATNTTLGAVTAYRSDTDFGITGGASGSTTGQWRKCTGIPTLGPGGVSYDKIDPMSGSFTNGSGTATATGTGTSLTDSTKAWTTDQWVGYAVRNNTMPFGDGTASSRCGATGNSCSTSIMSNTGTVLTLIEDHRTRGNSTDFTIDDSYTIYRAEACLNQTGYADGDKMTIGTGVNAGIPFWGGTSTGWPNAVLTPAYFFLNSMPGHAIVSVFTQTPTIKENLHFYNQAAGWYNPAGYPLYDMAGLNGISRCTAAFNGTCGVGVLTKAAMDAITTCTENVGVWVTNEGTWNLGGVGNPALGANNYTGQGLFYKCDDDDNWVLSYTPLNYPHPNVGDDPTVLGDIDPDFGAQGDVVPVSLTGTGLSGTIVTVAISGAGVTASAVTDSATEVTANFTITGGATPGTRNVTVTVDGVTSNSVPFEIIDNTAPTIQDITPSTGYQGSAVPFIITGTQLDGGSPVVNVSGTGIAITGVSAVSPVVLIGIATISTTAATSDRTVTVTTSGGVSNELIFTVLSPTGGPQGPLTGKGGR